MQTLETNLNLAESARLLYELGFNVIPLKQGTKLPNLSSWEPYKQRRQEWNEIRDCYWSGGIAGVNGINGLRSFDFDQCRIEDDEPDDTPVEELLVAMRLPFEYPWVTISGSGRGYHVWFVCQEELSFPDKAKYDGVPNRSYQGAFKQIELRWKNSYTILPPTPLDQGYWWKYGTMPDEPLAILSAKQVEAGFFSVAVHRGEEKHLRYHCTRGTDTWAKQVRKNELEKLRRAPQGGRNTQLNASAFRLGRIVAGGYLEEEEVVDALSEVAEAIGLEEREIKATIQSGMKSGMLQPYEREPLDPDAPDDSFLTTFSADDKGNAQAVKALYGERFVYTETHGWLFYTGTYWERINGEAAVTKAILDTLTRRGKAAFETHQGDVVKASIANYNRVKGAREILKSLLADDIQTFDNDKDAINCLNGVVHLKTGVLEPHAPTQRFTYCIPVEYDPDADCAEWKQFVLEAAGSEEMTEYLQMAVGYAITGHTSEECLFYIHGPRRSGKGTFTGTLGTLFPEPISHDCDFNTFTAKRDNDTQHFDLAPLKSARLVFASESNKYQSLNPSKVKMLTGRDKVNCAFKHKDHFSYEPQFVVFLSSNHEVNADADDDALWGRIKVIPFMKSHYGKEDKTLKDRLKQPVSLKGIFVWAVEGAKKWYAAPSGLVLPEQVKVETARHRGENDHVGEWFDECCERSEEDWTSNARIMESYTDWCKENNVQPKSKKGLAQTLREKGFDTGKIKKRDGKTVRGIQGLKLTASKYEYLYSQNARWDDADEEEALINELYPF